MNKKCKNCGVERLLDEEFDLGSLALKDGKLPKFTEKLPKTALKINSDANERGNRA